MEKLVKTITLLISLVLMFWVVTGFLEPYWPWGYELTKDWLKPVSYVLTLELGWALGRAYQKRLHKKYCTLKFVHPPASVSKSKR